MVHFRVTFDFPLFSKPRGKLGKYGNIYHSSADYIAFKTKVKTSIYSILPMNYPFEYPIGVALINEFTPKIRGHEPDLLDNQLGALLDTIVANCFLKDDSRKFARLAFTAGIESTLDHSTLWLFDYDSRDTVLAEFLALEKETYRRLRSASFQTKYKF